MSLQVLPFTPPINSSRSGKSHQSKMLSKTTQKCDFKKEINHSTRRANSIPVSNSDLRNGKISGFEGQVVGGGLDETNVPIELISDKYIVKSLLYSMSNLSSILFQLNRGLELSIPGLKSESRDLTNASYQDQDFQYLLARSSKLERNLSEGGFLEVAEAGMSISDRIERIESFLRKSLNEVDLDQVFEFFDKDRQVAREKIAYLINIEQPMWGKYHS